MELYVDDPAAEFSKCCSWIKTKVLSSTIEVLKTVQENKMLQELQNNGVSVIPASAGKNIVMLNKLNMAVSSMVVFILFIVSSLLDFFSDISIEASTYESPSFHPPNHLDTKPSFERFESPCQLVDLKSYFSFVYTSVNDLSGMYFRDDFFAMCSKFYTERKPEISFFSGDYEHIPFSISLRSVCGHIYPKQLFCGLPKINSTGLISLYRRLNVSALSFGPIRLPDPRRMLFGSDEPPSRTTSERNYMTNIICLLEHHQVCSSIEPTMIVSSRSGKNRRSRKHSTQEKSKNQSNSFSTTTGTIGTNGSFSDPGGSGSGDGNGEGDGQGDDRKLPRPGTGRKRFRRKKTKRSKKKQTTKKIPDQIARVVKDNGKAQKKPVFRHFTTKEGLSIESDQPTYVRLLAEPSVRIIQSLCDEGDDYNGKVNLSHGIAAENQREGNIVNPTLPPPPPPTSGVNAVRDTPGLFSYAEVVMNRQSHLKTSLASESVQVSQPPIPFKRNTSSPCEACGVNLESSESMVVGPVGTYKPPTAEPAAVQILPVVIPTAESACPLSVTKIVMRQRSYTGVDQNGGSLEESGVPDLQSGAGVQSVEPVQASSSGDSSHTTLVVRDWEMRVVPSTQSIEESVSCDARSQAPSADQLVSGISAPTPLVPSVNGLLEDCAYDYPTPPTYERDYMVHVCYI